MRHERVLTVRVYDELAEQVEEFLSGFDERSDGLRALLVRGLYLDETPKGSYSESAWRAAYVNYLVAIHGVLRRAITGAPMHELMTRALLESAERLGFDTL